MSCVYCAPKSRISMRCAWMSGCAAAAALAPAADRGTLAMGRVSGHPVVGCLLGDADIVYVALPHTCARDAHEHRAGAQLGDVVAARVAHCCTQTAGELAEYRYDTPLVGDTALYTFGHELLELGGRVLEVAVGRAMTLRHGTEDRK